LRVAVTRPRGGGEEDRLSLLLRERGGVPLHYPATRTASASNLDPLRTAAERIAEYDWLVVTSARAVPPLMEALTRAGMPAEEVRSSGVRICAVGPRTAEALSVAGLSPEVLPERFIAEGVVSAIMAAADLNGARVLFPRAEDGREVIPRELAAAGATVDVVSAYRTEEDPSESSRLATLVGEGGVDALAFTAGSAARSFAVGWGKRGPLPEGVGIVALGPATAGALREGGLPVHAVAEPHTLEGLVDALEGWARTRGARP
jgi:uroporphyrinogen-III synthase